MRSDEGNLPALLRAASINPYDAAVQARIAIAAGRAGRKDESAAAFVRAAEINPWIEALQHACARALIEDGRYSDAYVHYQKMLTIFPRDSDALINYGLLAARLGHPEEAIDSWQKAVEINPDEVRAQLYLGGAYDAKGEAASAARHWNAFISFETTHPNDSTISREQIPLAAIHLADDEARLAQNLAARTQYESRDRPGPTQLEYHNGKSCLSSPRRPSGKTSGTRPARRNRTVELSRWTPMATTGNRRPGLV